MTTPGGVGATLDQHIAILNAAMDRRVARRSYRVAAIAGLLGALTGALVGGAATFKATDYAARQNHYELVREDLQSAYADFALKMSNLYDCAYFSQSQIVVANEKVRGVITICLRERKAVEGSYEVLELLKPNSVSNEYAARVREIGDELTIPGGGEAGSLLPSQHRGESKPDYLQRVMWLRLRAYNDAMEKFRGVASIDLGTYGG